MNYPQMLLPSLTLLLAGLRVPLLAEDYTLHSFERRQLTDVYFSEGANAGDLNGDKIPDVVYGPYWFSGPDYKTKYELYAPVPQDVERYADNFFNWIYDFNGDGKNDVFVVGFPGTPAYVYENPGRDGFGSHWKKHQVFDWVSNESPQLIGLLGDERPELVCTRDGYFGFATVNWDKPFEPWTFHLISEQLAASKFGHGLGIGDINGDGRQDLIHAKGWFEQPQQNSDSSRWPHHDASFTTAYGGAEMHAYDVDGDGDSDVITSEAAHDFGLSWYEQVREGDDVSFKQHLIMGADPSENRYGVVVSELHSVALVDMDGDGLKDIVTGKTYWSHHRQSPMWDAGAVVYWFKLVRNKDGVDWVPFRADDDSGIGRQVSVVDVNGDDLLDIVLGGMKGAHVLTHSVKTVSKAEWEAAQPKVFAGPSASLIPGAKPLRGPKEPLDKNAGTAKAALEAETLNPQVSRGQAGEQNMAAFKADAWSGGRQLFWTGGQPGDKLTLPLPAFTGTADVDVVLTCARDYAVVQLWLDDQKLGDPVDLYESQVVTTGLLTFPNVKGTNAEQKFTVEILGANPKSVKAHLVGIDYLRVRRSP